MPPKRSRLANGEELEMAESIKKILKKVENLSGVSNEKSAEKVFVLKNTFTNMSEMVEGSNQYSRPEEHFGQTWKISIRRNGEYLGAYLTVYPPDPKKEWFIETLHELELLVVEHHSVRSMFGYFHKGAHVYGAPNFLKWEDMKENFLRDDKLNVQIRVKVLKMAGNAKPKAFDFGEANKEHSDVVLKVGEEKFYLQRGYLAHHSDYFRRFFSKNFKEGQSGLQEFPLSNTDAQDFQNFLEVLYGNAKVDEFTVGNILLLIDFYNSAYVRGKCEKFLIKKSMKPLRKKLELSSRFQLNALADDCFSKISRDEYKALGKDGFLDNANLYVSRAYGKKSADFL